MVHVRLEPGTFWFNDDETHIDKKTWIKGGKNFYYVGMCGCMCVIVCAWCGGVSC